MSDWRNVSGEERRRITDVIVEESRLKDPRLWGRWDRTKSPRGAETLLFKRPDAGAGVGNGQASVDAAQGNRFGSASGCLGLGCWSWGGAWFGGGNPQSEERSQGGWQWIETVEEEGNARPHPRIAPASHATSVTTITFGRTSCGRSWGQLPFHMLL